MSAATVFRREMRQFGLGLVAGPVVGLGLVALPLVMDRAKAWTPGDWWELGAMMGLVVALGLVGCQAATTLAAPLGARRSGFELSRPLSLGAMVGGRLAASGALGLLAYLGTLLLPALTHAGGAGTSLHTVGAALGIAAGASLVCAVGVHPLSVGLRARTPWLGLEWAGLLILGLATVWGLQRLVPVMGIRAVDPGWFLGIVALLVLGLLAVASWRGLDQGRVLLQAVHRTQARMLGGGLLVLALGVGVYAGWMGRAVAPWELQASDFGSEGAGEWVLFDGEILRGGSLTTFRSYLRNTRTGAWMEVGLGTHLDPTGRRAAWMAEGGRLAVVDLQGTPRLTYLELQTWADEGWVRGFTPDGRGVLLQGRGAGRVDLDLGRLVWTNSKVSRVQVLNDRRALARVGTRLMDLDLATGETRPRLPEDAPDMQVLAVDGTGERLLLTRRGDQHLLLAQGATLVDLGPSVGFPQGTFLEDGSLVTLRRAASGEPHHLVHRSREGHARELPLPGGLSRPERVQRSQTPGALELIGQDGQGRDGLWSLDVATGKTERLVEGARPMRGFRLGSLKAGTPRLWVQGGQLLVGEPGHLLPLPKGPRIAL